MKFNPNNLNIDINDDKSQNQNSNINKKETIKIDNQKMNFPPKKKVKKKVKIKKIKKRGVKTYPINPNSSNNYELNQINQVKEYKSISIINEKNENFYNNENNINSNLNDYELNSLSYKEALKFDKRTYLEYYLSLIRTKQLIIFSFFPSNDYNSRIVKICLFFFSFALYYIVNALFFNDSTMHKIYIDEGEFNFIYQIPQILYSAIISAIFNSIIKYFCLSE
jgi:hypothetical protein